MRQGFHSADFIGQALCPLMIRFLPVEYTVLTENAQRFRFFGPYTDFTAAFGAGCYDIDFSDKFDCK